MKEYKAHFDCGNDIVTIKIQAASLKEAKIKAKELKKTDFDNDRRIKVDVRFKD